MCSYHKVNVTVFIASLIYVDAERHDVVLVPTATVGINSVVQSVVRKLKPGAAILMLNLAYGN